MIKLREFSLSDLVKVVEIGKISFPRNRKYCPAYFKKLYQECPAGFIVAEKEEKAVGYIIGRPKKKSAEIVSLAVAPDWRQKGIGTKLTASLMDRFRKRNLKKIFLRVRAQNEIAISFYENLGFKTLKTVKKYYQNNDDAYLMKRLT